MCHTSPLPLRDASVRAGVYAYVCVCPCVCVYICVCPCVCAHIGGTSVDISLTVETMKMTLTLCKDIARHDMNQCVAFALAL